MNRKMFMRCISYAIIFIFILQSSMGTAFALSSNWDWDMSDTQESRIVE